jgi:hypothetical protein
MTKSQIHPMGGLLTPFLVRTPQITARWPWADPSRMRCSSAPRAGSSGLRFSGTKNACGMSSSMSSRIFAAAADDAQALP